MKLHLNLPLRRALLAAMAAVATFASSATAGLVDARYDLQYYLDFGYNMGLFRPGATNITVPFKDGTSVSNATIPLMPNLDSYATRAEHVGGFGGGAGLVAPQYAISATHCKEGNVYFITRSNDYSAEYSSTGYKSQAGVGSSDWSIQRLNKIVTEVAYTPYASDYFMRNSMPLNETWLYRTGQGDPKDTYGGLATGRTPLGGLCNVSSIDQNGSGTWVIRVYNREFDTETDTRPPLEISMTSGDSGSPVYAWDNANDQFLQVGFTSAGNSFSGYTGDIFICYNPTAYDNFIDSYEVKASNFSGTEKILWGSQDAVTGKGTLTQGSESVEYTGSGSGNTVKEHLGLTFSTADKDNTQTIELQGSVNMGVGAMTFNEGSWKLTEKDAASTFNSAGFVVNSGAELTLELTASANEEWRKVGEGIMTIAGKGNNEAVLRVGGGNTVYNVTRDEAGNITGCTLGNAGETRLNRADGYAASSVRLEGGVAIITLMGSEKDAGRQFKTNSVAGDTFTFGNAGGLLNLNGHELTWGVINQDGSGKGARIGNFTPLGETTPGLAKFTYTGTGTFDGCFVDESNGGDDGKAQLAVVYDNATTGATWTLTGNHDIAGGYTVNAGTLVLQGTPTPHSYYNVSDDWDYARMQGSNVTVESGAAFQLSHHALLEGDVIVKNGGTFIMNQVVNADAEARSGGMRENKVGKEITSMKGDVVLKASGSSIGQMVADVSSSAVTVLDGNIRVDDPSTGAYKSHCLTKTGDGVLFVSGTANLYNVNIEEGGFVVGDATTIDNWQGWTIGEKGFLAAIGIREDTLQNYLNFKKITAESKGVLALTANQTTELTGAAISNGLYIGAWGDVSYGTSDASLTAYKGEWHLGGGTGTLTVNFKLTGNNNLIIGNEWSSGTVHLTNSGNDFNGEIIIKGTGNMLTYESVAALGNARVDLSYGNALAMHQQNDMALLKSGAQGVMAVVESFDLDMTGYDVALGAVGDVTFTGSLTVGDGYRFGGSGNLTLDTELDGSKAVKIDGQGTTGSSVTFAREDAYIGSITAGGGLNLSSPNSRGDIGIHVGHGEALASVAAMELQQGATLYMDGQSMEVRNLTAQAGSAISNNGENAALLVLNVGEGESTAIADGVLNDASNSAALHIVKSGTGTLTMGANASWAGGMTISQGTVVAELTGSAYINAAGGIGATSASIQIDEGAKLQLKITPLSSDDHKIGKLGNTILPQTLTGTGTVVLSSGSETILTAQASVFNGSVQLKDNTRLYVGKLDFDAGYEGYNNLKALSGSTIVVESGSQAKVTNSFRFGSTSAISTTADFVISGHGYAGVAYDNIYASSLKTGALSIDNLSTVYGNITLAADATIASSSRGSLKPFVAGNGATYIYGDSATVPSGVQATYGVENYLGGIIRGRILGEGKDLTFGGNEGMTITADSANTFRDLIIANGNGNNDDKFALRLNGGKAVSQTYTALGKGIVTLNEGLILRLAGTGTANQTDVEYTYANNFSAGDGSTIQSYNITNKLTGTVSMAEGADKTLNLATAQGGVLHLSGGVSGSGTLNIGAASKVILGAGTDARAASTFTGNVVTAAGADITLESAAAVAATTTISGTDSLTLRLAGTDDYTLGGISVSGENSVLTLHFDFTGTTDADDADTWTTLRGAITATTTTIALDLNMFNDISRGNYVLLAAADSDTTYTLADTQNNRLSLFTQDNGALVLKVDADNRLYWRPAADSNVWDAYTANWFSDKATTENGLTAFTSGAEVMLDESGVREGNSATSRETIGLADTLTVGNMAAQEAAYEITGGGKIDASSLTVGNKGDLKLSNTGGNAFADGVLVNDSALMLRGSSITGNVELENAACMSLYNKSTVTGNVLITDSSMVVDNSIVAGRISTFELGSGAVLGTITESNGTASYSAGSLTVTHNAATGTDLHLSHGTLSFDSAFSVNKLTLDSGSTAVLRNNAKTGGLSNKISTLEMGDGAVLSVYNVVNDTSESADIGMVHLTGESATINEVYGSGYLKIGSLSMAEGLQSTTLNLTKASELNGASYTAVYEIGSEKAGNFVGDVVLSNIKQGNNNHSVFITLAGKETLANAVVKMDTQASSGGYLGLGIMADGAIIAGLQSSSSVGRNALLFSGEAIRGGGWNTGDENNGDYQYKNGGSRTLVIDSAEGSSYSYYGRILSGLSLVKTGEGTQAFYGRATGYGDQNFNGSIELQSGTLVFGADALGMLSAASSVTVNGGTLDISSYDFNTGTSLSINNFTFSDTAVLALGNLQADTTYNFFTTALENWMSLTADNFTINGTALSDWQRASLNLGMDGSFSYSIEGATLTWQGGTNASWDTTTANWDITPDVSDDKTTFYQKDNVVFNDAASNKNVQLTEDITAGAMSIESGSYRFYGAQSLSVDTLTIAGKNITTEIGNSGKAQTATELTVNLNSKVAGTLDLYWSNAGLNLKGDNHEIGGIILRGADNTASALNLNAARATVGSIQMWNNSSASFGLAENADSASYSVGSLAVLKNPTKIARTITVQEGVTLNVTNDYTIKTGHALVVDGNLNINNLTYTKNDGDATAAATTWQGSGTITVNGTTNIGSGSLTIAGGSVNFNGATTISGGTLAVSGGAVNFNGATTISGGTVKSTGATFGKKGGTITMTGGKLSLSGESAQSVLSTLNVADDALLVNEKTNVTSVLTRTLSSVGIATGATLELQTVPYNTNDAASCKGAVNWYINNLSGAGDLKWTSYSYHDNKASHLVLGGDGSSFTGKVIVNRDFDQSAGGYQTYVELASDNAAKNAILSLNGKNANAVVALAVNTKDAEVGGLDGSEFAHLYSGAAVEDKKSSADAVAVTNSRIANTLAITGSGTYNFAGTVGRAEDTARLSLAMIGTGTQTFSGTSYLENVTVNAGCLELSGAVHANGVVTVSGGELVLSSAETAESLLGGAKSFNLNGDGVLDLSNLTFNTLGDSSAATITLSGGAVFNFQTSYENENGLLIKLGALEEGVTYQLFDSSNGILNGWDTETLNLGNFSIDGVLLSEIGGSGTTELFLEDGTFCYTFVELRDMVWTGGDSGVWSEADTELNWDNVVDESEDSVAFINASSATFESRAEVTLEGAVEATWMDVTEEAEVTLNAADGASLTTESMGVYGSLQLNSAATVADVWVEGVLSADASNLVNMGNIDVSYGGTLNIDTSVDTTLTSNLNGVDYETDELGTLNKTGNGVLTWDASDDMLSVDILNISTGGLNAVDTMKVGSINASGTTILSGNYDAEMLIVKGGDVKVNYVDTNSASESGKVVIGTLEHKFGVLTLSGELDISTLKIDSDGPTTVYNATSDSASKKTLSRVELGSGSQFVLYNKASGASAINIGVLQVNGAETILKDSYNSGYIKIGRLDRDLSTEPRTLKIQKGASSDKVSRFEFGSANATGGNFTGRIEVSSVSATNRPISIILSGAEALSGAVIDFTAPENANEYSYVGLGINTSSADASTPYATIAGLESDVVMGLNAKVYSGTFSSEKKWDSSNQNTMTNSSFRTLKINTEASDAAHDFYGEVLSQVNLEIAGTGTQNFLGKSSSFDGSITLTGGTMGFNDSGSYLLNLAKYVVLGNGTVKAVESFDVANSGAVTLTGTESGTTFDTNGNTITINSELSGAGNVVKSGVGDLVYTQANTYAGTTSINAGTLKLQGAGQVGSGDVSIASGAKLAAASESAAWASISAAGSLTAKIQDAVINQTAGSKSFSLVAKNEGTAGTLNSGLVELAPGASLRVENMLITGGSRITGQEAVSYTTEAVDAPSVTLVDTTIALSSANATVVAQQPLMEQLTLQSTNSGLLEVAAGASMLTVDSIALCNLLLTGNSSFTVDLDGLLSRASLDSVDILCLNFVGVAYEQQPLTKMVALINGQEYDAYYDKNANTGWVGGVYFDVRVVPEPTTATLSLLALAGLCARRRRKD